MSRFSLVNFRPTRKRALATVAVAALAAAGALGGMSYSASTAARAAAVDVAGLAAQPANSFAPLIERVKPAVVSVKVKSETVSTDDRSSSQQFRDLPPGVQRFFRQFGQNGRPQTTMALGSGFFISADGYIVTNNHVVRDAESVTVTTDDGQTLGAKVVGADPKTDLALLKVDKKGDYPFVSFAKEAPRVGDWVVAIGEPYGLGGTVTAGIVSAEGRDIGDGPYDQFMQIDAPINRGNSGGPTFNTQGEVVGVNTAIYTPSGGSVGIGFDIPASAAASVVDALEHGGVVTRGYLGVAIQSVNADIADSLGLKTPDGAIVDQTMPGTPAAEAGLKPGDVIVKVDGQAVKDAGDLTRRVAAMKPGEKAEIGYLRDGAEKTAEVALASQKSEQVASVDHHGADGTATLGLTLAPAAEVAGAGQTGVAVVGVDPDGEAASKGVVAGDVILEVAGKPVSTPDQVQAGVDAARQAGKRAVLMRVQTAQGDRFVALGFPAA